MSCLGAVVRKDNCSLHSRNDFVRGVRKEGCSQSLKQRTTYQRPIALQEVICSRPLAKRSRWWQFWVLSRSSRAERPFWRAQPRRSRQFQRHPALTRRAALTANEIGRASCRKRV